MKMNAYRLKNLLKNQFYYHTETATYLFKFSYHANCVTIFYICHYKTVNAMYHFIPRSGIIVVSLSGVEHTSYSYRLQSEDTLMYKRSVKEIDIITGPYFDEICTFVCIIRTTFLRNHAKITS